MKWFTKKTNMRNVVRQPARNIVEVEIDPLGIAKDIFTPLEVWQSFVKDDFGFFGKLIFCKKEF